jgi:hypothetical protein
MDGSQSLFAEIRDSEEAARQAEVYERAMASIRREALGRERSGYVVMSAMTSGSAYRDGGLLKAAKMFLIAFACIMPVFAFWAIAL